MIRLDQKAEPVRAPKEVVSKAETLRRTATHPTMNWKEGHYAGINMPPPRGEDPVILSRGMV